MDDLHPIQQVPAMSACALARAYRAGTLTPQEAINQLRAHIAAINPRVNALVQLHPDLDAQARESTERFRTGAARSALEGIPVAIKDNILTADMPTCWGTPALRDRPGAIDEIAVSRLRAAGAILLGKTNVPEFTLEGYTGNPVYGTTRNPWNTALTPGGSSGGAAAGLAAGLFPLALGTDGGGSIRRPSSHTGVIGLKPSIGAVARAQTLPPLLLDFEVVGPLARDVDDLALLFDVIAGPHVEDPRSTSPLSPIEDDRPLRILYVPRLDDAPVDPEITRSVEQAAMVFTELGHQVEQGPLPFDLEAINRFWPLVGQVSLARLFQDDVQVGQQASAKYRQMAADGAQVDAPTLLAGLQAVDLLRRHCASFFTRYDLILMPAAAALPWAADAPYPSVIDGRPVGPRGHAIFTGWVNAAGHPAIALPCTPAANGLPIGLQLVGARGADWQLLALARKVTPLLGAQKSFPML